MEVSPSRRSAASCASWGRRLAALLVDASCSARDRRVALVAAGMPADGAATTAIRDGETLLVIVLFVIPKAIYDTALIGSRNQTFGKMALRDQGRRRRRPRRRSATHARSGAGSRPRACWALFTVPAILDHLWPLRDRRRQAFHDKFARSVVVRT